MLNKFKRLNALQIISLLIMIISFVLYFCKIKNMDNLFWIGLGLNMLGILSFHNKWCQEGKTWYKKLDTNYDKNLTRKPSDLMFFMIIGYYFVICMSVVNDFLAVGYLFSAYNMLPLISVSIMCNFMGLNIVDKTSKEVKTLIMEYESKLSKKGNKKDGNK